MLSAISQIDLQALKAFNWAAQQASTDVNPTDGKQGAANRKLLPPRHKCKRIIILLPFFVIEKWNIYYNYIELKKI